MPTHRSPANNGAAEHARPVRVFLAALGCGALVLAGCPSNSTCSYPVTDPGDRVINLAEAAPLSRKILSNQNSGFGEVVPDSYLQSLAQQPTAPLVALEVVSALHDPSACGVPGSGGDQIPAGPLSRAVLQQALPDGETLVVEPLTLRTLFNTLEHGVAGGAGSIDSSAGRFVLVAGLTYTVDCSQPAEAVTSVGGEQIRSAEGQRVVGLSVAGRTYARAEEGSVTAPFAVALSETLAQGGDAYFDLRAAWQASGPGAYSVTATTAFQAVASYLGGLQAATGAPVTLSTDGRVTFENCSFTP